MNNFISVNRLKENLKEVVILDVRFDLHDKEYGQKKYKEEHIDGSFFIDLDRDLAGVKKEHGGSRPLPEMGEFIEKIERLGITKDSSIVVYDEEMVTAARAFWMFKYIGHEDIKILDGGYAQWVKEGGRVTEEETPLPENSRYDFEIQNDIYAEINEVKEGILDKDISLVECRSHERYLGLNEPFYSKPGHIPTALCIDSKSLLKDGKVRSIDELKEIFRRLDKYKNIVFSCGSGVNASLDYAVYSEFFSNGKVYIGSYSDWTSYPENPIEIKDEN
ncbi:sulfurtransferase [Psychrilyobacter sp. S5]|uniref:sulfurtransferase n=1 Tax=Psychrilyobacter sp. S5 TaxID=2283384 RepID=UPI002175F40B|nr:sulfurtransferase [Psychrilyobacter sp. S5]MCS5421355.1 sulfurtransferase [Psychrilyobacter sp. S5]